MARVHISWSQSLRVGCGRLGQVRHPFRARSPNPTRRATKFEKKRDGIYRLDFLAFAQAAFAILEPGRRFSVGVNGRKPVNAQEVAGKFARITRTEGDEADELVCWRAEDADQAQPLLSLAAVLDGLSRKAPALRCRARQYPLRCLIACAVLVPSARAANLDPDALPGC
jgi:hypothetical protein